MRKGRLCDKTLLRWYRDYNRRFFNGELGDVDVLWAPEDRCAGIAEHVGDGNYLIKIDPGLSLYSRCAQMILLHEMVHVKLHPYGAHGPAFQAEMMRLAKIGALTNLW